MICVVKIIPGGCPIILKNLIKKDCGDFGVKLIIFIITINLDIVINCNYVIINNFKF